MVVSLIEYGRRYCATVVGRLLRRRGPAHRDLRCLTYRFKEMRAFTRYPVTFESYFVQGIYRWVCPLEGADSHKLDFVFTPMVTRPRRRGRIYRDGGLY